MKIILVHSSQSVVQKAPWVYFGASYLKMKHWESKLSGNRINLQKEIHSQAVIQKTAFLKWIEAHRISNKDSIYWWMTQIAGRNNAYSNFYLNLCQFFAIKDFLQKNSQLNEILIVCEDVFLLKMLSQNFSLKFKFYFLLKFYLFREVLYLFTKGLLNQFRLIYFFITNYFYARFTKPKKLTKPFGDVTLFHHCLDNTNAFENEVITCKYFTILPSWLKKKGIKVFGLPYLFKDSPSINFYKNLRKTNCLIPEDWLSLIDYFYIFKSSIKSFGTLTYEILFPGAKINQLIFREKLNQLSEANAIFWRYIPAIQKWSTEIKSLTAYDQYQNMIFEHPIRYIIKKLPFKSISIGFYHSLVTKEFMAYQHLHSEWSSSVKPDYVACLGKIGENLLLNQGVPPQKLLSTAALRQHTSENKTLKKKSTKQLLVLLSLSTEASIETLTKVYSHNSLIINELKLKVKVKIHPMMKVEHLLKEINWNKLPDDWEWTDKNLDSEINDSYCIISMFTASAYDAVLKGNIVISLMSDLNLMDNYLDLFSHKYPCVHSVSEKGLSSKLKDIFVLKTQQYQEEFSKIRKELIEGTNAINSQSLDAFIPKNE